MTLVQTSVPAAINLRGCVSPLHSSTPRPIMHRVGLALSGGGFRATMYHLGVVRFLRDAEILPKITHIACVSGGSILGAHLALNWEKYCGSASEFDDAAGEILRFVQLDARNRIVRRFPLMVTANMLRRWCRLGNLRGPDFSKDTTSSSCTVTLVSLSCRINHSCTSCRQISAKVASARATPTD